MSTATDDGDSAACCVDGVDKVVEGAVGDPLGLWEVGSSICPAGGAQPAWRGEADFRTACAGKGPRGGRGG